MRFPKLLFLLPLLALFAVPALGDDFANKLHLDALNTLSLQHEQTVKTFDSFARQMMTTITGHRTIDGEPSAYTILDMTFRPEAYSARNIIKIKNTPLRNDFRLLDSIDDAEKDRIVKEGTISLKFWLDPKVRELMSEQQQTAVFKAQAIGQVQEAATALESLGHPDMNDYHWFAPATNAAGDHLWHTIREIYGTAPDLVRMLSQTGGSPPAALSGYDGRVSAIQDSVISLFLLREGWKARDADKVNECIAKLAVSLPAVSPDVYPSLLKRKVEVIYNHLFQLTIPAIMLYFIAFVLFLLAARSGVPSLRLWGLRTMVLAFAVHTLGIAVRWWLVEKSVGNYFEAIPIKNMFESVMFSAWFGALVGLILEFRYGRSLFGAAASFVGTLAMVALFTVPFFFRDIGGEIGQVNGVLMSYWLYIHVTMVTASYALIGMGFLLSVWWLVGYYRQYGSLSRVANRAKLSADGARGFAPVGISSQGGTASLSVARTFAELLFLAKPRAAAPLNEAALQSEAPQFQAALDACNLVVLQLAFWVLGVGIILGAVWADQSWGRPWGWDPKETFALVTWIVYLIVVHVRVATQDKAWWTAVLSVIGFFIMLFNWIGVNFFLVGLHSYA
jgi:cytochrome c-type biogenesis protein CcsB